MALMGAIEHTPRVMAVTAMESLRSGIGFNSDIRNEPQERRNGRGSRGVRIAEMVKNYPRVYFFLD